MTILDIAILIFIFMEAMNVLILYFKPNFKYGNSMKAFKAWEKLNKEETSALFTKYMVNWVANTKLIFIALLAVILFTADDTTKFVSIVAVAICTAMYYIKLHPIIRKLDKMGDIEPKGYSKTLLIMISAIICMFFVAILIFLLTV